LEIEKSKSSGTYVVVRFGNEPKAAPPRLRERTEDGKSEERERGERRPRGGRGRSRSDAPRPRTEKPRVNETDDGEIPDVPTYRPRLADVPPPLPAEVVRAEAPPPPPPRRLAPPRPPRVADPDGFGAGVEID
jgi:hypothetical protein